MGRIGYAHAHREDSLGAFILGLHILGRELGLAGDPDNVASKWGAWEGVGPDRRRLAQVNRAHGRLGHVDNQIHRVQAAQAEQGHAGHRRLPVMRRQVQHIPRDRRMQRVFRAQDAQRGACGAGLLDPALGNITLRGSRAGLRLG